MTRISIIVATYNGEKYIYDQLISVVSQMTENDEMIITDDGSEDGTVSIIKPFLKRNNIILISGPGRGIAANFENGIRHSHGDIVLICDQDDIWCSNKLERIRSVFQTNTEAVLVMHNADFIDGDGNKLNENIYEKRNGHVGYWKSIFFSSYYGCCMAIKRDFLMSYLPFPPKVLYDQYIGACAERIKKSIFIGDVLIYHRRHLGSWSKKQGMLTRITQRILLLKYTLLPKSGSWRTTNTI